MKDFLFWSALYANSLCRYKHCYWCGEDIRSLFLGSGVQVSPKSCCLHRVILRWKSEHILAQVLQWEVCHILYTQISTTVFIKETHKWTHTHIQPQSVTAGQTLMPKKGRNMWAMGAEPKWVHCQSAGRNGFTFFLWESPSGWMLSALWGTAKKQKKTNKWARSSHK